MSLIDSVRRSCTCCDVSKRSASTRVPKGRLLVQRRDGGDMPDRRQLFTGNSFLTTLDLGIDPVWEPLEHLAATVRQRPELPQFHPSEFMYMAAVHGGRPRVTIHLFKHIDTRRYLNVDDAGHAYAYQFRQSDPDTMDTGGRYRRYRSIVDALEAADLRMFEGEDPLFRSFPPDRVGAGTLRLNKRIPVRPAARASHPTPPLGPVRQGRRARSNSCWSRGRRRWITRRSAMNASTSEAWSVPSASLRIVARRRAASR